MRTREFYKIDLYSLKNKPRVHYSKQNKTKQNKTHTKIPHKPGYTLSKTKTGCRVTLQPVYLIYQLIA